MSTRSKRFRGGRAVPLSRTTRVDKKLKAISKVTMGTTQVVTVLLTATFPCTITGLRWNLSFINVLTTGNVTYRWCIVRVKDGVTVSTTSLTDAGDFYTPEQEVLAFGVGLLADTDGTTGPRIHTIEGSTKSMRKLMGGDTLQFLATSDTAAAISIKGIIQFFCRT